MNIREFAEKIKTELADYFEKDTEILINPVRKNNGVMLTGIVIMEKDSHMAPTIYIENFYEEYGKGKSFGEILFQIIKLYERNRVEHCGELDFFKEYEKVRKKISYKLINAGKNKELLKEVPYIPYLDLVLVFYCDCTGEKFGNAAILIKNCHLEMWGVTTEDIYKEAVVNTPRNNPYEIKTMEDIMKEMFASDMKNELERAIKKELETEAFPISDLWLAQLADQMLYQLDMEEEKTPMYVLSNTDRINGAACMLYTQLLENFSKKIDDNLYILPSSVHEIIIVPAARAGKTSELKEMVEEINATQVEEEEVLSDSVYFFNRSTKMLELA